MAIYRIIKAVEFWVAAFLLCAVLGLTGWASITRFLGVPNIWVLEVTQVLFAWVCFLAAVVAFRSSQHFSVDLVADALPADLRPWLSVLRSVLLLAIVLGLAWISLDYVEQAYRRKLPLTGIRFSWVAAAMPAACLMMAAHCIETLVTELRARKES